MISYHLGDQCRSSGRNSTTRVAATLMALHVTAHGESLATASVGTPERLLTSVTVRMDAQAGRTRERLVACPADIAVMVLLVRGGAGWREVVVVLPGGSHWGDERRRLSRLVVLHWLLGLGQRRSGG